MSLKKVSIADALENVTALDNIPISDHEPYAQAQPCSILYQANFDTNFEDRTAFVTGIAKYIEEANVHATLNDLLEEGHKHAAMLYTWRCCSRAIPKSLPNDHQNRTDLYQKIVEVLAPEVDKLANFLKFQRLAIDRFCSEVKKLCHSEKKKDFVSEAYLLILAKLINMFAILDELKKMKSSIKNDYSAYRRAAQIINVMSDPQELQESQNMSIFLGTQNVIRTSLKDNLARIPNFEDLLIEVVNVCVTMFEEKLYLLPAEKHMLANVLGFALYLVDTPNCHISKLDQKKKISLDKIDQILKKVEVIPLFGDMQIAPFEYIRNSQQFDKSKWPLCSVVETPSGQGDLLKHLPQMRKDHLQYITDLAQYSNLVAVKPRNAVATELENEEVSNLALKGLQLLSEWTSILMELQAWRLLHPTDQRQNKECPANAEDYERGIRYNYSKEEKFAWVEIIAMIKGVQGMMSRMERDFSDGISRHVFCKLQTLVQLTLREPLRKAVKNKRDLVRGVLVSVQECCADMCRSFKPDKDPALRGKKDPFPGYIEVPKRAVGPRSTQLFLVRTILESLISDKAGAKKTFRKDIDGQHLVAIAEFLNESFYWNYLLNFTDYLQQCADLSQLWYREYYLEASMGNRIQFPIEMSLPWILIDHVLVTKEPSMTEYILYPLDLYNDSAHYALQSFHKQHLYDEVEAEVNLCFDQFVFKLSEQVFSHVKQLAGNNFLDKRFRKECAARGIRFEYPKPNRYEMLLRQRHVQLLGRSVDLTKLVTQRINLEIVKSLEVSIARFQGGDLTAVMELEALIAVNRLTYGLLKKWLSGLDDFDRMLKQANHNISAPHGKITLHVFCELNYDFLPNYCYNSSTARFVRSLGVPVTPPSHREKIHTVAAHYLFGTKSLNLAFATIFGQYSGFVGSPHFRVIVKLLGYRGVALLIQELLKIIKSLITGEMLENCRKMMTVMPKSCKMPGYDWGSLQTAEYYLTALADILEWDAKNFRQNLREVGNALLFCLLVENAMSVEDVWGLGHAAAFQGIFPQPFCKYGEAEEQKRTDLEVQYAPLNLRENVNLSGTVGQRRLAEEADLMTKERLCVGLSIFDGVLRRMGEFLKDPVWKGPPPQNRVMAVDECSEFQRLWSALQLRSSVPVTNGEEFNVEQLYGEGLNWAGLAIIVLLGQQHRFQALDFSYHILRAQRDDKKDGVVKGAPLGRMVVRIRQCEVVNSQILAILNKYLKRENTAEGQDKAIEYVRCFQPPIYKVPEKEKGAGKEEEVVYDYPTQAGIRRSTMTLGRNFGGKEGESGGGKTDRRSVQTICNFPSMQ